MKPRNTAVEPDIHRVLRPMISHSRRVILSNLSVTMCRQIHIGVHEFLIRSRTEPVVHPLLLEEIDDVSDALICHQNRLLSILVYSENCGDRNSPCPLSRNAPVWTIRNHSRQSLTRGPRNHIHILHITALLRQPAALPRCVDSAPAVWCG